MTYRKYETKKERNPLLVRDLEYSTTPCPIKEDIKIGSYKCESCEHYIYQNRKKKYVKCGGEKDD
jgi:hypothetical protein